jgi:hypothetical protein
MRAQAVNQQPKGDLPMARHILQSLPLMGRVANLLFSRIAGWGDAAFKAKQ